MVLKLDCTGLIFVDAVLRVIGAYYCDELLSQQLLPAIHQLSDSFVFQQHSVAACMTRQLSDISISQGSVATRMKYGEIFNDEHHIFIHHSNDHLIANFPLSEPFLKKNRSIFGKDIDKSMVSPLFTHVVVLNIPRCLLTPNRDL